MTMYKTKNGWTKAKMIEAIQTRNKGIAARNIHDCEEDEDVSYGSCVYETKDGNHCAVGCFLPSGDVAMQFFGGVYSLLQRYPHLSKVLPISSDGLAEMQHIHDSTTGLDPRPALIEWIEKKVEDSVNG